MSYEFNPKSTSLEFPNPFTVENYFFFASAALETVAAVTLLFLGRNYFEQHNGASSAISIAAGIAILTFAVLHAQRAMGQLRFFFGRSLPVGLAPEMSQGCDGYSRDSEWLKKTVRQNAIDYPVPEGALNGLLYSRIRDLIFAPVPIQRLAQRQFHNALAILATLISFLVSWACSSTASASWMGLFYFVFSLFLLLRPLEVSPGGKADMGSRTLILLVVFTILGPVAITTLGAGLPDISWLWLSEQTLFVLVAALAGVSMFFGALLQQMNKPPQTNPALEQRSLSMNCHPNQLMGELDRKLQMEWTEQIPNRRYSRISPQVSGGVGTFQAEILEETQDRKSVV